MAAQPLTLVNELKLTHHDHEIDARGLSCPLPMLSTRKSLEFLQKGEVLKFIVTDRGAKQFFESLSRQTGLELLLSREFNGESHYFLRKP